MVRARSKREGVVLLIVLATVMLVVIMANFIIRLFLSQTTLTHHQISRIQAYYAAMAGVNLALENLRTNTWTFSPNSCPNPDGCLVNDANFPPIIRSVRVIFCPRGTTCAGGSNPCNPPADTGINFCINSFVNYTYAP